MNIDIRRPAAEVAVWRELGSEFLRHVQHPDQTELVITDRYEQVVTDWKRQTPEEFDDRDPNDYVATKIDGTRAAAKTVVLSGGRAVVVASAKVLTFGMDVARWMLVHEAQHVRLHQNDRSAWAVHRRSGQEIVAPRPWVFVWAAQNAIDEYRCELAVHAQLPQPRPTYSPNDVQSVLRFLRGARSTYRASGDLADAYEIVVQAIDRLAVIAAYTAAAIAAGHDTRGRWVSSSALNSVWVCLRQVPPVDDHVSQTQLWRHSLRIAEALDEAVRRAGMELVFDGGGMALYFLD